MPSENQPWQVCKCCHYLMKSVQDQNKLTYLDSSMHFIFNMRRAKFLLESGLCGSIQHFMSDGSVVWRPTEQYPFMA